MSFTVSSSGAQWDNFKLKTDFIATTCYNATGTIEVTVPGPGSITNNQFSYTSSTYSFTGQFNSASTASGTYSFANRQIVIGIPFPPYVCYYYLTQSGTWSASIPVPAPGGFNKSAPADGAVNQSVNPTLTWGASAYADNYEYCYDSSDNDACDDIWRLNNLNASVELSGLDPNTTYYWQARSNNSTDTTYADGGDWWSFTTASAPGAFGKSAPADGAVNQSTAPTLSWNSSSGAASYEYCYDTSGNDTCDDAWTSTGANTSIGLGGLSTNTIYYWQVRAVNAGGTTYADAGAWRSFTTVPNAPGAFGKSAPADGAVNQSTAPTISWNSSSGAASYEYCYDTTDDNACSTWVDNGASTGKTLTGLSYGVAYYWHVRAVSPGGITYADGSAADFWSFTTKSQAIFRSAGAQDGWILESSENANAGGTMNSAAATLRVGDDATRKQYRSILSFDTSGLPDNAIVTKVTLKVRQQSIAGGGNPIAALQGFMADIRRGIFGTSALQITDWQATASKTVGPFSPSLVNGWYAIDLTSAKAYINKLTTGGGLTQIRLRFKLDDNNNSLANYLSLFSGEAGAASRPQLIVEYYAP